MKNKVKEICEKVIKEYVTNKNILGIMLFGSTARMLADKYSDIDIYILTKDPYMFSRRNFIEEGIRVDIIFNTTKEAEDYLRGDLKSIRRITSHMLANGNILYDTNKILMGYKQRAEKNLLQKTKYSQEEILMHKYSIDDFWGEVQRDIDHKDYLAFGLDTHLLIQNILELFLKKHGKYLVRPIEIKAVLENIDPLFQRKITEFYKNGSIKAKKKILSQLVSYIYKKTGGPLSRSWHTDN